MVQPFSFNDDVHAGRALRGADSAEDEATRMANRTASPVASLIWWAIEQDIEVIWEQPRGSMLGQYTLYRCVLAYMDRHHTDITWEHAAPLMVLGQGGTAMTHSSKYTPAFARALLRTWR